MRWEGDIRVVRNLIARDIPVRHEGVVCVVDGGVVGHLGLASIRVLAVCEELVDGVEGEALDGIVGREDDKHGSVTLWRNIRDSQYRARGRCLGRYAERAG